MNSTMTQLLLKINIFLHDKAKFTVLFKRRAFTEHNTKMRVSKKNHLHECQNQLHGCGNFHHRYMFTA